MDITADRVPVVTESSPRTVAKTTGSGVDRERGAHADTGVAGADSNNAPAAADRRFAAADISTVNGEIERLPVCDGSQEEGSTATGLTEQSSVHGSPEYDFIAEGFFTPSSEVDSGRYYRGLYTPGAGYIGASVDGDEQSTGDAPVSFRTPECRSPAAFDQLFAAGVSLRVPSPQSERSTPGVYSPQSSANVLPEAAQILLELEKKSLQQEEGLPLAPERSNSFDTVVVDHDDDSVADDHQPFGETTGNTPDRRTRRFFRRAPTKADIEADKAIVRKWFEKTANLRTITVTAGSRHVKTSQDQRWSSACKPETKEVYSYLDSSTREFDNNGCSSGHSSDCEPPNQGSVANREAVKGPSRARHNNASRTEGLQPLSRNTIIVSVLPPRQVFPKKAARATPPAPKVALPERHSLPPRLTRKPLIYPRRRRRRTMDGNAHKDVVQGDDDQQKQGQQLDQQQGQEQYQQMGGQQYQQMDGQQYQQMDGQQYQQMDGQQYQQMDGQQYQQMDGQQDEQMQPEEGQEYATEQQQDAQQYEQTQPEEGQEYAAEQFAGVTSAVPRVSAASGEFMPMAEIILITTSLGGVKYQFFQSNLARHILDCKGVVYYVVDANRDFTTATSLKDHILFEKWNAEGILKTETIGQRTAVVIPQLIIDGVSIGNTTAMQDLEDDGDLDYIIARMLCPSCLAEKPQDAVQCPSCNTQYDMLVPPEYCDGVDIQRICQGTLVGVDNAEE
ncbi:THEOREDOXIN domain containing protein,putative [Babesia bigemina]|uniref:THEOREDOXIN domain containing protein,putative n=1 Tax=Babesia bigemina TaxID=5866 RepID=A0A061D5K3_BABBI|nr:THEOREDOXIN domain containing protein,putative [Babesia bigemina]CDR96006.1 THEOREDOXIN domain containing protein,putative [Babesia bigemina]|eukprot:XP_012768192.1 THEOREDOXIN domain containing protein,putative [Babesia bigemina]